MQHQFFYVSFTIVALWFVLMAGFELNSDIVQCNTAYECANTTLSFNDTDNDNELYISGYFGASYSNLNFAGISVYSGFGIYKSKSVNVTSHYGVICGGLYSCAMVEKMIVSGAAYCSGELSCHGSDITIQRQRTIYYDGDRSCSNSIFRGIYDLVFLKGRLSGFNSTFITQNLETVFRFEGSFSEYNASIICCNNCTCNIYCPISNCDNLNYQCDNNNCSINVFHYASGYVSSFEGIFEFNYSILNDENELINNFLIDISTMDNSINMCKDNVMDCFDYGECNGNLVINEEDRNITDELGPAIISSGVCCEGSESCYGLTDINILNNDLRCDGSAACLSYISTNNPQIMVRNGDIYFSGGSAGGWDLDMYESNYTNDKIISALGGNVYVTGGSAVYNMYDNSMGGIKSTISNSKNVYCTGYKSCLHTNIINISNNVYFYGRDNCYWGQIISNIGNTVYIHSYLGSGGTFKDIYKMVAIGTSCMSLAKINNVRIIEAYGSFALQRSIIVSNIHWYDNINYVDHGHGFINDNSTFNLTLYGPNSGYNMGLTCSENDKCYVNCIGEYSCFYSAFYCNGHCIISCNNPYCPDGGKYSILNGNYTIMENCAPLLRLIFIKIVISIHLIFVLI